MRTSVQRAMNGKYLVAARHLKAGEAIVEITIREDQNTVIPFTLAVPNVALTSGG